MTLQEIKDAVLAGKTVCHISESYEVRNWPNGMHIVCTFNDYATGLTWQDGVTMNGKPEDFFIKAAQTAPLATIDIPAGYPNEAALVAWLRTKGYDANVCDSARVLWNGEPVRWDSQLSVEFDKLELQFHEHFDQQGSTPEDGHAVIRLDGKAWSWSRDSSATRLQQRGVPEHIALAAITLAVLGGKAIVFGADGATITVERG